MPIQSNRLFGPISQAIDLVAHDSIRNARRLAFFRQRGEEAKTAFERRRSLGRIEHIMSLQQKGALTPESSQGILEKILAGETFDPGDVQLRKQQMITAPERFKEFGVTPGAQMPLSKAERLSKIVPEEPEIRVPLPGYVAKAIGRKPGAMVTESQYIDLVRLHLQTIREKRLSGPVGNLGSRELANAIDDTRIRLNQIERNPFKLDPDMEDERDSLRQRHNELLAEQDKRLGRKPKETIEGQEANRITTLQIMLRKDLISPDTFKQNIRDLWQQLGGDENATRIIEKSLGL